MIFSNIIKDKHLRLVSGTTLVLVLLSSAMVYFKLKNASLPLVIHFNEYVGVDFFGGKFEALGITVSSFAIILVNFFLADFIYDRERFLSYILVFCSLGIAILILMAIYVIISVN
ncbi:MAG: hypothetical protein AAB596_01605 [Patescibacteria group bacterium]